MHQACHQEIFSRAQELNCDCHRFLDGRSINLDDQKQIVTSVLFARIVELYQSIIVVSKRGMTAPTNILFRSLLEAYFHFAAIEKDPDYLNDYINLFHIQRKTLVNKIHNSSSPQLENLRQKIDDQLVVGIQRVIDEEGARRINVEEVARRAGLHDIYLTTYALLSRAVHTSASDLESHIQCNKATKEIEGFKYGPSEKETARVICLSGMAVSDALEWVSCTFGEDRKDLSTSHKEALQTLLPEIEQENASDDKP